VLSFRASLAVFFSTALIIAPAFASRTHKAPASNRSHSSRKLAAKSHKLHGQQVIDTNRVTEIQQALIREHYLNGEANGNWDATTQAAMRKFQGDQGWQTKLTPDSRALKKLGLGPDYSGAINAKNSTFADPPPISTIPAEQSSGFAAAAGVNR
jgi:peptidoglycan hydrolase-like protein with peptidoglycan-binding domain